NCTNFQCYCLEFSANYYSYIPNSDDANVCGSNIGFLRLSGAILVQVQHTLHIDPGSFILMLTILPIAIALLLMYFVDVHNAHRRYNKKFLDAFSLMAVIVARYLMVVIICDQVFVTSSAGRTVFFVILLL
uniref:Nodulin-like domain-containing protein n=1 Tax=Aegilops tauschii subsp. strangulata TaxID=200361 RepID=A0A452XC45_AEGTS